MSNERVLPASLGEAGKVAVDRTYGQSVFKCEAGELCVRYQIVPHIVFGDQLAENLCMFWAGLRYPRGWRREPIGHPRPSRCRVERSLKCAGLKCAGMGRELAGHRPVECLDRLADIGDIDAAAKIVALLAKLGGRSLRC